MSDASPTSLVNRIRFARFEKTPYAIPLPARGRGIEEI
jgi:hypothetical protein